MKFKTTFRLFVLVCLLGSLVFLVDYRSKVKEKREIKNHLVFDLANEAVSGIKIVRSGQEIECIKKGHDWFLKEPVRGRGNAAEIERIVCALEESLWSEIISDEDRKLRGIDLDDYGLESPSVVLTVETDVRSMTLFVGDSVPMGDDVYARRDHSDDVLTVPAELTKVLPGSIETLRERTVLHGTAEDTVRLEIERKGAGFIQLVKQDGIWMIQQPLSARADSIEVQLLLENLYDLKVKSFFWDVSTQSEATSSIGTTLEMASSARIESCGLATDAAQMRVTVWVDGDTLGQELLLGKPDPDNEGSIFAKRGENDAIFCVDDDALTHGGIDLNILRNRSVFYATEQDIGYIELMVGETRLILERSLNPLSNWTVVEPVKWVADGKRVDELLSKISSLSVHSYLEQPVDDVDSDEIKRPQCTVSLRATTPDEVESVDVDDTLAGGGQLLIGEICDQNDCYFAKMSDKDEVFQVGIAVVDWLNRPGTISPLYYRDRSMLAVNPQHVRRIDVSTSSGVLGAEFSSTQGWSCVGMDQMTVDSDAIGNLLTVMSDLQAEAIEIHNPKELEPYGLATPVATVTLGLQGEDNVQKSLLIGNRINDNYFYAMVRGQDLVFMVADGAVSTLLTPICIADDNGDSVALPEPEAK